MKDEEKKHWEKIHGIVAKAFKETPSELFEESQFRLREMNYQHAGDLKDYKCHECAVQKQKDEYADMGVLSKITELWALNCETCKFYPNFMRRNNFKPIKKDG